MNYDIYYFFGIISQKHGYGNLQLIRLFEFLELKQHREGYRIFLKLLSHG